MFRKLALTSVAALSIAACTQHEQRVGTTAAVGAVAGGALGAVVTGDAEGALVGAAIGGATGAVLGHVTDRPGYCQYNDGVIRECPPGY